MQPFHLILMHIHRHHISRPLIGKSYMFSSRFFWGILNGGDWACLSLLGC
jgi:hypothetical protein